MVCQRSWHTLPVHFAQYPPPSSLDYSRPTYRFLKNIYLFISSSTFMIFRIYVFGLAAVLNFRMRWNCTMIITCTVNNPEIGPNQPSSLRKIHLYFSVKPVWIGNAVTAKLYRQICFIKFCCILNIWMVSCKMLGLGGTFVIYFFSLTNNYKLIFFVVNS